MSVLFVAVHKGPYLTVSSLEKALVRETVVYLVEGAAKNERIQNDLPYLDLSTMESRWGSLANYLKNQQVRAVIRSTSDDVEQCDLESMTSMAAGMTGVPVFVVEDFPGNYRPKDGEPLNGLFVEHKSILELHRQRGINPNLIHISGNPRYKVLCYNNTSASRATTRSALGLSSNGGKVVLWAGQPDYHDSYQTLTRLFKHLPDGSFTLLFKAHPRDEAYSERMYDFLLNNQTIDILDVTSFPDTNGLYCASDLVVTQFSSAGVEASFMGTPTLFVLFNDLGKRNIKAKKGYSTPPWCVGGGAFLIEKEDSIKKTLELAIFDQDSRSSVINEFKRQFVDDIDSSSTIADHIRSSIALGTKQRIYEPECSCSSTLE